MQTLGLSLVVVTTEMKKRLTHAQHSCFSTRSRKRQATLSQIFRLYPSQALSRPVKTSAAI